jgi:hypothetical protein
MRRRNILLGTLALAVVVATIGGVGYALHTRTQAQADGKSYPGLHAPVSVVCPGPTSSTTTGQGGRGIRPRNDCTPSFTQQDVRDYVAHGAFLGFGFQADGQPTVTRVIFLTIGDLDRVGRQQIGRPVNTPADMLVCYAELSGPFTLYGVGSPESLSTISMVFDAHTGTTLATVAAPLLA